MGGHQEISAKKGVGVQDLLGDQATSGQVSGTITVREGEGTVCQAGMMAVPDIFEGRQTAMGKGSVRGYF